MAGGVGEQRRGQRPAALDRGGGGGGGGRSGAALALFAHGRGVARPSVPATARSRGARSGEKASLVTSPVQTRSQSALWSSSAGWSPMSASRSSQKRGRRRGARGSPRGPRRWRLQPGVGRRRAGEANVLAEVEGDAAVAAAAGAGADPDQLAAGAELVEPGWRVGAEAAWQHVSLPDLRASAPTPCSDTSASRRRSRPAPAGRKASTFCQLGRKRASWVRSAASTSRRRRARLARRTRRRTSESHHSRSVPPGSSSPRTIAPSASSSRRAGEGSTP